MTELIKVEPDKRKWDHSNDFAIICTCSHCGSSSVTRDAVARFSTQAQCWELSSTFDNSDCDICGETRLVDTPLDHWTGDVCVKEELPAAGCFVSAKALADGSYIGIADGPSGERNMIDKVYSSRIMSAEEAKDAARGWLFEQGLL